MESGRRNFIIGYDPLGWGEEPSWNQEEEILSWHTTLWGGGGTFMESGRKIFNMGYDPSGWGGGHHGIRKRKFYHGTRSFRVGGANIHGIRKKKFYHGIQPFRVGGDTHGMREKKFYHGIRTFRVGGGHSWNQEEETLSWDTIL